MELVAVENCTLKGPEGSVITVINKISDSNFKIDNSPVISSISFSIEQETYSGTGIISQSSCAKTLMNNCTTPPLLKGDKTVVTLVNKSEPYDEKTVTVYISDVGQSHFYSD